MLYRGAEALHVDFKFGKAWCNHRSVIDNHRLLSRKTENKERHRNPMIHMRRDYRAAPHLWESSHAQRIAARIGTGATCDQARNHDREPVAFLDTQLGEPIHDRFSIGESSQ